MRTRQSVERSIAVIRLVAVPFAVFQVAATVGVPQGWQTAGWITTAVLAVGAGAFALAVRRPLSERGAFALSVGGQVFDTAIVSAYVIAYSLERGTLTSYGGGVVTLTGLMIAFFVLQERRRPEEI